MTCASVQRAERTQLCMRLFVADRRPVHVQVQGVCDLFSFRHWQQHLLSPLINSHRCLRLFSRLKSPSTFQRHVWRPCAQPSAIHCCCDTYRVHSACRRLPRIFHQSCQRCTRLFCSSHTRFSLTRLYFPLTIPPADTQDYSPLSPWHHNRRGSRALCPLVNPIT